MWFFILPASLLFVAQIILTGFFFEKNRTARMLISAGLLMGMCGFLWIGVLIQGAIGSPWVLHSDAGYKVLGVIRDINSESSVALLKMGDGSIAPYLFQEISSDSTNGSICVIVECKTNGFTGFALRTIK